MGKPRLRRSRLAETPRSFYVKRPKRRPGCKPWPADKSPLHPSALRLRDVHPGVAFRCFNKQLGYIDEGVFLGTPVVINGRLKVKVRYPRGWITMLSLADIGITPYSDRGWNGSNFTVAARKQHLLPEPTGERRTKWRWNPLALQ